MRLIENYLISEVSICKTLHGTYERTKKMSNNLTNEIIVKKLNMLDDRLVYINSQVCVRKQIVDWLGHGGKRNDVYTISPAFWSMTIRCLENDILLGLAKICDDNKDVNGINKIINIVEQNGKCYIEQHKNFNPDLCQYKNFEEMILDAKSLYYTTQELRERLKKVRDKDLAHTDKTYALERTKLYQEVNITFEEVGSLINVLYRILDIFITCGLNNCEGKECPDCINALDVWGLIDNAHIGQIYRQEYYQEKKY